MNELNDDDGNTISTLWSTQLGDTDDELLNTDDFNTDPPDSFQAITGLLYGGLSLFVLVLVWRLAILARKFSNAVDNGSTLTDIVLGDGLTVYPPAAGGAGGAAAVLTPRSSRGQAKVRGEALSPYYGNSNGSSSSNNNNNNNSSRGVVAESDGNERAQIEQNAAAAAAAVAAATTTTAATAAMAPSAGVSAEEAGEFRAPPPVGGHGREGAAAVVGTSMMDTRQRATPSSATPTTTTTTITAAPPAPPTPTPTTTAPPAAAAPAPAAATASTAAAASAAASSAAAAAAAAAATNGRRHGPSDGREGGGREGREGIYQAVMEAAQELAERSQIPGVGEAAALVSILVNLVADSRSNAEGAETRVKQCRSIIRLLQRAAEVLGKGGDSTRKESESEMIEDVHDAVADMVQIIKIYQSRNKVSQVLMSTLFKRRQEEAEAVIDRAIWRLNLNLHVEVGQKLHEVGEDVKEGLRLQAAQASKETMVAEPISESLAEARRVRRQRKLHTIQIPEDHVMVTDELLGKGGFGVVYIADYNGRNAAAKVLNVTHDLGGPGGLNSDDDDIGERKQGTSKSEQARVQRRAFLRELDAMMRLRSPHTVNVYGAMMSRGDRLVLVMELLAGGDLLTFLRNSVEPLPDDLARRIIGDVCAGMAFLHAREAVHGDLKSANVLLDGDGRAKIGDFGTSKWVQHTNSTGLATYTTSESHGAKMSLAWAAPEVLETKGTFYASDVYSFGIVTWEVITRRLPWADQPLSRDIFLRVVMKGERPVIPTGCPPDIAQVIRACWAELPADRPTFDELAKGMKSIG